jgi:hypothetical protein
VPSIVAAAFALNVASMAQQSTFIGEPQIIKRPVDVELTPNGKLAVVRGHAPLSSEVDGLTVVDTATGNTLSWGSCQINPSQNLPGLGGFATFQPSDFIRTTNSRAILIGGRDTDGVFGEDTTYIDVLAFDVSTTVPTVTCLAHHEVGSTTSFNLRAGWVNDVEITPDESFAIVNSTNWIHVIDMATGDIARAFNIGSAPWQGRDGPSTRSRRRTVRQS